MLLNLAHTLLGSAALALAAQSAAPAPSVRRLPPAAEAPLPEEPLLDRAARAQFNIQSLRAATRWIGDLTAEELQDVIDLDRMLSAGATDTRSLTQRCVDQEVQRLGGSPSRLAWRVIDLKCREVG